MLRKVRINGEFLRSVVPRVGFEPTRPKAEDFESTKSTSSITEAHTFET
jgi:hypothetical protein